jgi:hypothetical protein
MAGIARTSDVNDDVWDKKGPDSTHNPDVISGNLELKKETHTQAGTPGRSSNKVCSCVNKQWFHGRIIQPNFTHSPNERKKPSLWSVTLR